MSNTAGRGPAVVMARAYLAAGICFVVTLGCAGCMTHGRRTFNDRLIRPPDRAAGDVSRTSLRRAAEAPLESSGPGSPESRPKDPDARPKGSLTDQKNGSLDVYIEKMRHLTANARPVQKAGFSATAESWDPSLASALQELALAPGARQHRRVAEMYRRLGVLDAAYDHFARAAREDPADAAAFDGLARIWRDWGRPDLGLEDARRAIDRAPDSPAAFNTFGTLLQALGRTDAARAAYERALALDARASYALNNLCYLLTLEGRSVPAIAACRQALQVDAGLRPARNNLALAYAVAENLEAAGREFAASGSPAAKEYNMGIVYLAKRQFKQAAAAFEAAHRLQPSLGLAVVRARQARMKMQPTAQPEDHGDARD